MEESQEKKSIKACEDFLDTLLQDGTLSEVTNLLLEDVGGNKSKIETSEVCPEAVIDAKLAVRTLTHNYYLDVAENLQSLNSILM